MRKSIDRIRRGLGPRAVGVPALALSLAVSPAIAPCASRGAPQLASSQPAWTPQAICAALAWREGRLSECSFRFTEECKLSHAGTAGESLLSVSDFAVRRHKGATWIDFSERNVSEPTLDTEHLIQVWNGSRCTWFERDTRADGTPDLEGGIKQTEPQSFTLKRFFTVLGLRQAGVDLPWSAFISQTIAKGSSATVSEGQVGGERRITLVLSPNASTVKDQYTFVFLPDRDFVVSEYKLEALGRTAATAYSNTILVSGMHQYDGIWMPDAATTTTTVMAAAALQNTCTSRLEAFTLAAPTDQQMEVNFPVGTEVLDGINLQDYIVLSGGKKEYRPFYDLDSGREILPGKAPASTP